MARTPSTMLEIGTNAPDFSLPDPVTGKLVRRDDFSNESLLVIFSCNHCPYVIHILDSLTEFANNLKNRGIGVVMINANDVLNYADDSPEKMVELSRQYGFKFPYLYDESQAVAKAYRAACTPDFFLFNQSHKLVYRGQYDGARPGNNIAVEGTDLKSACTALLSNDDLPMNQLPSMGCNIKWKQGNEPEYF